MFLGLPILIEALHFILSVVHVLPDRCYSTSVELVSPNMLCKSPKQMAESDIVGYDCQISVSHLGTN